MTTLASDIIQRAFRETNLIAAVATPNSTQTAEALPLLNEQFLSALGNEAGDELAELNIGGSYDQSSYCATWVPPNVRLVLNLAGATALNLHPQPYPGMRLAIVDAASNLASYNLTLSGNGRKIEAATSVVLNTNGIDRQWLYRGDTANWVKMTALVASDAIPFPQEFDSYFVTRLALRLSPRYAQALTKETAAEMAKIETKLRARYRKPRPPQDMPHGLSGRFQGGLTQADFVAGRTYR